MPYGFESNLLKPIVISNNILKIFFPSKSFLPAMIWFIIVTVLFLLPGSEFPQEDWFEKVYLDKLVHIAFVFLLVYLFLAPLKYGDQKWTLTIAGSGIMYGVGIEFIQKYFVKGRSFELADMACDITGCLIAYFVVSWQRKAEKK
jgi:hypothetical protein